MSIAQVIVSLGYGAEWRVTYRLGIRGALIHGITIDDDRNVVGMRVNTVSTMTAGSLGEREYEKMDEGE